MKKPKFRLMEISLDDENIFWVSYQGYVPEQGGIVFGKGQIGLSSIEDVANFVKHTLTEHRMTYREQITKRTKEIKET